MDAFEKWLNEEVDKTFIEKEFQQHVEAIYIKNKYRAFKRGEKL